MDSGAAGLRGAVMPDRRRHVSLLVVVVDKMLDCLSISVSRTGLPKIMTGWPIT